MKVRIGYMPSRAGGQEPDQDRFRAFVLGLERHGFDSLWLPERVTSGALDPAVGLAYAAALTTRIKFGMSVMTLPGRSPARLAAQLASLDRLSGGRLLPAFGLGQVNPAEQQAFGVRRQDRAREFEEALPLVRRFWTGLPVTHHGERFSYDEVIVGPRPAQEHPDVWMGGAAPAELRRTGRLADGWLGAFSTPAEGGAARVAVAAAAAEAGREIDDEHYGVIIAYRRGPLPEPVSAQLTAVRRRLGRPADLDVILPRVDELPGRIRAFVDEGVSKFVLAPVSEPPDWDGELTEIASTVLHLQTSSRAAPAA